MTAGLAASAAAEQAPALEEEAPHKDLELLAFTASHEAPVVEQEAPQKHVEVPPPTNSEQAPVAEDEAPRVHVEISPRTPSEHAPVVEDEPSESSGEVPVGTGLRMSQEQLLENARKHRIETACTKRNKAGEYEFLSVWKTTPQDLGFLGVGVRLYFEFIKLMGLVFVFLSFLSLPAMVLNAHGTMVEESGSALYAAISKISVANLGLCPAEGCASYEEVRNRCALMVDWAWEHDHGNCDLKLLDATEALGLLDGLGVLAFIAFVLHFAHRWIPRVVQHTDKHNVTPADYSVWVTGLPKKLPGDRHSQYGLLLAEHFRTVLKKCAKDPVDDEACVQEVMLVRDYDGSIARFTRKGQVLQDLENARALLERAVEKGAKEAALLKHNKTIDRLSNQVDRMDRRLRAQADLTDEARGVCSAFVTFQHTEDRDKLLEEYRFAQYSAFRLFQSRALRFEDHRIQIYEACEPTDLYWENLDFKPWKRLARRALVFLATLTVLILCSVAIAELKAKPSQAAENPAGQLTCATDIALYIPIDVAASAKAVAQDPATDATVDCFCTQQSRSDVASFITPPFDTPEQKLCVEWAEAKAKQFGFLAGSIVLVLVLNQVLLFLYSIFVAFERVPTLSELTRSQMWKLFISLFMNTGLLLALINANFKDSLPSVPFLRILSIGIGDYTDFTPQWFVAVGATLVITITGQIFTNTMTPLCISYIVTPLMARLYSRSKVTQEALNAVYVLPDWNLSLRLAQTLNVIFCIMMYSGGMPILYPIGALYCFMAYWLDKFCLLRGSRRPPASNQDVMQTAMHILPWAAFLHVAVTAWIFGNQVLFPSEWSALLPIGEWIFDIDQESYNQVMETYRSGHIASVTYSLLSARFLDFARKGAWLLMLIFVACAAYYIVYYLWLFLLRPFLTPTVMLLQACLTKTCPTCCARKSEADEKSKPLNDAIVEMREKGITSSYRLSDNRNYRKAYKALEHTRKKVSQSRSHLGQASVATLLESAQGEDAPGPQTIVVEKF